MFVRCLLTLSIIAFILMRVDAANPIGREASFVDMAEHQQWSKVAALLENKKDEIASVKTAVRQTQADGMTALHWASFQNRSTAAKQLVEYGADADAMTVYHVTPLSLACEYGNADAVEVLIDSGVDVSIRRLGKETPLMLAARNGSTRIVGQLIEAGATVDDKEAGGQTALMWAAAAGNADVVKMLIEAGAEMNHTLPGSGFSAPLFAAREGKAEVMKVFVDAGFDVGIVIESKRKGGRSPRSGMSAMMLALESGHLELALWLVHQGADPNDQRSGFAPLHALTWVRKTQRGDNPAGDPPPRITGWIHSLRFVREIVAAGANVNLELQSGDGRGGRLNTKGATPFLLASRGADLPLMKLLLELGADPMMVNDDSTTALMAAAGVGVIAVGEEPGTPEEVDAAVKMLYDLGLDPNAVDRNRETAMHGAAFRTFPNTVAVLAELGADPAIWNQENSRGWTPFDIASGKRPGSVKPSPETTAALDAALKK